MTRYRSFYPAASPELVVHADAKRFPLRGSAYKAAEDARDFWHKEGEHTVPYRIDADGTVTELTARVRRVVEVG